jgi:phosphoglycerate dehydrogenase-like enzyme
VLGTAELALMKPTAYLVNTSRGPIVDEHALVEALRAKRIAGAGVDVFGEEPLPPGHAMLGLDNLVVTPHVGYVTEEVYGLFYGGTLENIAAYLEGKYEKVLNPEVLENLRPR